MRTSLQNLIDNAIILRYTLPTNVSGVEIPRSHISTADDHCLQQNGTNEDVAKIIYNGIVEYAYNDTEIHLPDLDHLQIRALQSKLKYNPSAPISTQLSYGFHGEVLLHLILERFLGANKCIARGYLYSALENSETKGYDSYLMTEKNGIIYLIFGEAKFYIDGYKSSVKMIFKNIDNALSDAYFHRNLLSLDNHFEKLNPSSRIREIITEWRDNPLINMAVCATKYNMHLVYPMLIILDDKANSYDELILQIINHIYTKYGDINSTLSIPHTIFFIFFPIDDSREVKSKVLQWISSQQPLEP